MVAMLALKANLDKKKKKAFEEMPDLVAQLFLGGNTWTHIINTLSGSRLGTSICR